MQQTVYRLFADLLEYPGSVNLAEKAKACADLLDPGTAALLNEFRAFVEQSPPERLEELYTNTFDLQVVCYPYVGYHLFGESYKRGAFLARLNEGYQEHGFSSGNELPDHLGVVLRFLAQGEGGEFAQTLLDEGLIPAVNAMVGTFKDTCTEQSRSASTEQSRSAGTEQSRSAGTEQSQSAGTEQSQSAGTEHGRSTGTEQSQSAGTEQSQSAGTEQSGRNGHNPYSCVLRALLLVLQEQTRDQ